MVLFKNPGLVLVTISIPSNTLRYFAMGPFHCLQKFACSFPLLTLNLLLRAVLFELFAGVEHMETFYWLAEPLGNILVVLFKKLLIENTIKKIVKT